MALISLIIPASVDNEARVSNIINCLNYWTEFKKHTTHQVEIVVIEEAHKASLFDRTKLTDKYIFFKKLDSYRKTWAYNYGAKVSDGNILVFLDADVFVNYHAINTAASSLLNSPGMFLGYNGVAVYTTELGKDKIVNTISKDWKNITDVVDFNKIHTGYKTESYEIANTKAVGGCLVIDRSTFFRIGQFNPYFIGWGYEDNEIISRARILQIPVFKLNGKEDILIHAWHDVGAKDKSQHRYYANNEKEVNKVEKMSKQQLEEYISIWNHV